MISFNPSVTLPDGTTITPPGWMWVVAFTIREVPWAMEEADKPEFKAMVKEYLRLQKRDKLLNQLEQLEERRRGLLIEILENENETQNTKASS